MPIAEPWQLWSNYSFIWLVLLRLMRRKEEVKLNSQKEYIFLITFFSKCLIVQLGRYSTCLTTKTSFLLISLKWNWKEKWVNYSQHIDDSLNFLLFRDKMLCMLTSVHRRVALQFLRQWTLGTRVYSLQDNDREEAVFVSDTRSACYGNHRSAHTQTCTHINSVPTAWLAGSQTPTPTLTAFTF